MANALIVVDVQNDFCPGGSLAVERGDEVAYDISSFIEVTEYDYVVATKDWHIDPGNHWADDEQAGGPDYDTTWPTHCAAGSRGADFHPNLQAGIDEIFYKGHYEAAYSGFEGRSEDGIALRDWLLLRDVDEVSIVGIATDYCVKATALDAKKYDLSPEVIIPLTAWVNKITYDRALEEMASAGVEIVL